MRGFPASLVRIDLRAKAVALIAMNAVLYLSTSLAVEVYLMSFAIALSVLCGRFVSAARFAAAFAILVAVELAVVPVFGGFLGGLVMFVAVLVRKILPVLSVGLLIIATTEVSEFLAVAAKLRVPRAVTVPLSVVFRYFPTLRQECSDVRDAMRMRGINLSFEHVVVPVMMSAVNVSDELSAAALCRGINRPGKHTCLRDARMSFVDWAVVVIALLSVAVICALKLQGVL